MCCVTTALQASRSTGCDCRLRARVRGKETELATVEQRPRRQDTRAWHSSLRRGSLRLQVRPWGVGRTWGVRGCTHGRASRTEAGDRPCAS
eukprot:5197353-Alexandrium_andersonii.AAC.2